MDIGELTAAIEARECGWLPRPVAAIRLAKNRAELDRQLSDPNCPPEKVAELTDELITVDMAMGPMRKAMGTAPAKKSLADVCRELGIPVVKGNGGGMVITGVEPPVPDSKKP